MKPGFGTNLSYQENKRKLSYMAVIITFDYLQQSRYLPEVKKNGCTYIRMKQKESKAFNKANFL